MKKINFFATLIMAMLIIASSSTIGLAQATVGKGVFTATVSVSKRDGVKRDNVTITFSKPVSDGIEYYKVIGAGKTQVKGKSDLIMALYYEPGLLAESVYLEEDTITIYFLRGIPPAEILSNILGRVIKITQQNIAPTARLEIDGYDPLLGVTLSKPKFRIPPPIKLKE